MKKINATLLLSAFILAASAGYAQKPSVTLEKEPDKPQELSQTLNAAEQAIKRQDWEEAYNLYAKAQKMGGDVTAGYNAFIKQAKTFKITEGDCDDNAITCLNYAKNLRRTPEVRELLRICQDLKPATDDAPNTPTPPPTKPETPKNPEKPVKESPQPLLNAAEQAVQKENWDKAYRNPEHSKTLSLVSDSLLSFNAYGGAETILVYPDNWTFDAPSQTWCTATPVKSSNPNDFSKLIIKCETNPVPDERTASLSVNAENKRTTINVTQGAGKLNELWRAKIRYAMNANPTYTFDNGDTYKGEKDNAGINGTGAYLWNTGKFYVGEWNQNRKNGTGIYIYKDFDTEDIDCNCPGCKIYVGGYVNDKISGQGSCYDRTGKLIYRGTFADGKCAGMLPTTNPEYNTFKFQIINETDGVYVGETKNGTKHGQGIFLWHNGNMSYGQYTEDKQNASGVTISYDGN